MTEINDKSLQASVTDDYGIHIRVVCIQGVAEIYVSINKCIVAV
jgi:hypothetical protein